MQENECQGVMGRIFGHKFKPRYSEGRSSLDSLKGCSADDAVRLAYALKEMTYCRDVCERCGKTVNKATGG